MFKLGDIIMHNNNALGLRVVTEITHDYCKVMFIEGPYDGKSYKSFWHRNFVVVGNILRRNKL